MNRMPESQSRHSDRKLRCKASDKRMCREEEEEGEVLAIKHHLQPLQPQTQRHLVWGKGSVLIFTTT